MPFALSTDACFHTAMASIKTSETARELNRIRWERPHILAERRQKRLHKVKQMIADLPLTPEEAEHLRGEVMLDPHGQAYAGEPFARIPERNDDLDPGVAVVENMFLYRAYSLAEMAPAMPDPDECHAMAREYRLLAEELHWH